MTVKPCSFRIPNFEVSSSYNKDCFQVIFGLASSKALSGKAETLMAAILARDAKAVGETIGSLFRPVARRQRIKDENEYNGFTQMALSALGFRLLSEIPGAFGRMELLPDLSGGSHKGGLLRH
jgi:hypothetical protein